MYIIQQKLRFFVLIAIKLKNKDLLINSKQNSFVYVVTYRNQWEVAPLKILPLFLAVLKLDVKDSFGYNKEIQRMGKTFLQ